MSTSTVVGIIAGTLRTVIVGDYHATKGKFAQIGRDLFSDKQQPLAYYNSCCKNSRREASKALQALLTVKANGLTLKMLSGGAVQQVDPKPCWPVHTLEREKALQSGVQLGLRGHYR